MEQNKLHVEGTHMVRTAVVSQMCINVGVIVFSVKNTFINLDLSTPNPYHF